MRFKCPKPETWQEEKERMAKWHKNFCWLPTRVKGDYCIWMAFVKRRAEWDNWITDWRYEYREIKKC